ncbi:hypothetical protein Btru_068303 [Bulinus truncatus]|nr:hypothetical protein Btru_068303 [Bulinus truncatus]
MPSVVILDVNFDECLKKTLRKFKRRVFNKDCTLVTPHRFRLNEESMARLHIFIVIFVGLLTRAAPSFLINEASYSTQEYLERTLNGLEKILDFFLREYKVVNLDAVIGSRIVEGVLIY